MIHTPGVRRSMQKRRPCRGGVHPRLGKLRTGKFYGVSPSEATRSSKEVGRLWSRFQALALSWRRMPSEAALQEVRQAHADFAEAFGKNS